MNWKDWLSRHRTSSAAGGLVAFGAALLLWRTAQPTNRRQWAREQSLLPEADIDGDAVVIRNFRSFRWKEAARPEPRYETRRFDLDGLERLDYVISTFGMKGLAAHTMLSFGFDDDRQVILSVEVRKVEGQRYSILQGMLRSFELMYVIGDERDLIGLRANARGEEVRLYPMRIPREQIRRLFLSMLERANKLSRSPEFYHSVANACTTNLIRHLNELRLTKAAEKSPFAVFSGLSDRLLFDKGLIGDGKPFKDFRKRHLINKKASAHGDRPGFSKAIRRGL